MIKKNEDPRIPKHLSGIAIVLSVLGVFIFIVSLIIILLGFSSPFRLIGVGAIPFGVFLFILSFILFGLSDLVYNSGFQNKLLIEILKQGLDKNQTTQ